MQEILDRVNAGGEREAIERAGARPSRDLADEKARVLNRLEQHRTRNSSPLVPQAISRVVLRLDGWMGSGHRTVPRHKYHHPIDRSGPVDVLEVDPVELLIMRLLAQTSPAYQYGVNQNGVVFSASVNGYSKTHERLWLSGLSRAAEDVAQYYYDWRGKYDGHTGGRFFERNGEVFLPPRNRRLLTLVEQGRP